METVKRLFINLDKEHYQKLKLLNKEWYSGNLKDGTFAKILIYEKIDEEAKKSAKIFNSDGQLCEKLPLFEKSKSGETGRQKRHK